MIVLGIETSCDETAAAVLSGRRTVLAETVYSQIAEHSPYGGVVPDIAARKHLERLPGIVEGVVAESGAGWGGLDAVAVTYGPGLAGALLVGMAAARGLALSLRKPILAVNHLEAHLYSLELGADSRLLEELCPLAALIVSGGHTVMALVRAPGQYATLGRTLDDAAGEALDKAAKLLGCGYPGGPAIERIGAAGNPSAVKFPRGMAGGDGSLDFSFSGLKTALLYHLKKNPDASSPERIADMAASFQEAVVDTLVRRLEQGAERGNVRTIAMAGGVSINKRLRLKAGEMAAKKGLRLLTAPPRYCGDNAAMVAAVALAGRGASGDAALALDAAPALPWP